MSRRSDAADGIPAGSAPPLTALPAFAYTAIQIWYGIRVYRQDRANPESP